MSANRAYEEVIDFIAAGTTSSDMASFQPSKEAKERVRFLIEREKSASLSPEEKSELDHYMQLEHIMRLAKARARQHLAREWLPCWGKEESVGAGPRACPVR